MKNLGICLFFALNLISGAGYAKSENALLQCLAKEEETIHKSKTFGPIYKLNQALVNEIGRVSNINIKRRFLSKVCNHPFYSPSLAFLETFLTTGEKIFKYSGDVKEVAGEKALTSALLEKSLDLFLSYLSTVQSLLPVSSKISKGGERSYPCLEEFIPHLPELVEKLQFLRTDLSLENILENRSHSKRIFRALKRLDPINQKCRDIKTKTKSP